jgi:prevent-host-death family protein
MINLMYNITTAQRKFEKLLRDAARGKEVILSRWNTPVARLIAIPQRKRKKAHSTHSQS